MRPYFMNSSVAQSTRFLYKNYSEFTFLLHYRFTCSFNNASRNIRSSFCDTLIGCKKLFITVICKNVTGLKDTEINRTFISHGENSVIKLAKKHLRFISGFSGISWITRSTSYENCAHKEISFSTPSRKGITNGPHSLSILNNIPA
jgi:hypothetical protein